MKREQAIVVSWPRPAGTRAGLLLVALLLAACAGTASKSSAASKPPPAHLSSADFALLVDYGSTAKDQPVRNHAEQTLDKRCMNKHGFEYILDPSTWHAGSQDQPYVPGIGATRTEVMAVVQRLRTGYHLYSDYRPSKVPPNDQYVRSLSPAEQTRYIRALFGPQSKYQTIHEPGGGTISFPTAGCVAQGERRLYGSPKAAQELLVFPGDLQGILGNKTTVDPAVVAKGKPWSDCVTAAVGAPFATQQEIVDSLKQDYAAKGATPAIHHREIAYAVADAICQFQSGLATVYARAFHRLADQLPASTRRLLAHLLVVDHAAAQRARLTLSPAHGSNRH